MGMIETASRIIKRFGQMGTFARPGADGGTPWAPEPGEPTYHTATVAVVAYEQEHRDGTLIQANDLRVLVSVEGLDIVPNLADRLTIGGVEYSIANVTPLDATKPGKSWLVHPDWLALFEDQIRPLGIGTHFGNFSEAAGASYRALADGDAAARSWARMRASISAN